MFLLKGKIFSFVLEMLETKSQNGSCGNPSYFPFSSPEPVVSWVPQSTRMRTMKDKGWLLVPLHEHCLQGDETR